MKNEDQQLRLHAAELANRLPLASLSSMGQQWPQGQPGRTATQLVTDAAIIYQFLKGPAPKRAR